MRDPHGRGAHATPIIHGPRWSWTSRHGQDRRGEQLTVLRWVKALHIIFVVCWFAGLFYLPRLFVNHAMTTDAAVCAQLAAMEQRLYRFVTPFAWLTVLFGGWLLLAGWDAW